MRDSSAGEVAHADDGEIARHNMVGRRRVLQGMGAFGLAAGGLAVMAPGSAEAAGGTGTNGTAITVAASNTPSEMSGNANYVCSGSNDDVTINSAIAALTGGQGEVVLLPGNYNLGSSSTSCITLSGNGLKLTGTGYGTLIGIPSGSSAPAAIVLTTTNEGVHEVSNLAIIGAQGATGGTHGIWSQCNGPIIDNVRVQFAAGHGFLFDGQPTSGSSTPSVVTYNALVNSCVAQACGQGTVGTGTRGDGFHVTSLHQSALFTSCFVDGGSGNSAALVTAASGLSTGTSYTSLPVAAPGAWANLSSGKKLVVCYDAGAGLGYSVVTVNGSVSKGATSIPIQSWSPPETFYAGSIVVLDPAVAVTGIGFFTNGSGCHFNDCHPYFCWVGHYTSEVASWIQGGEYETCAHSNVVAILPTQYSSCGFQVIGINSYGSPQIAGIATYAGWDGVQIADCYIDGAQSLYGIQNNNGHNHQVHDNLIKDALGANSSQANTAGIFYQNGMNHNIHHNTVLLTSSTAPSAQHYGVLMTNPTGCQVLDNNLAGTVPASGTTSTPISLTGTPTGNIVRGNVGYNPVGSQSVGVPSSGSPVSAASYDRTFYISAAAAGTNGLKVAISGGPTISLTASALNTVRLPAGQTLTPTYSNAPTWLVEGE